MKNFLFRRISKIVSANVNSLLDSIENSNPEAIMKQAVTEVEDVIEDIRVELREVVASKYLANKQLIEKNNRLEELTGQIEVAVKEGRDDLAEVAVSKQLDIEDQLPVLEKTLHDCQEEEKELEGYISALKSKIKEMEADFNMLKETKKEMSTNLDGNSNYEVKVENAEKAFDRAFQVNSDTRGRSGIKEESKLKELENLERSNRIQERLQRYKK